MANLQTATVDFATSSPSPKEFLFPAPKLACRKRHIITQRVYALFDEIRRGDTILFCRDKQKQKRKARSVMERGDDCHFWLENVAQRKHLAARWDINRTREEDSPPCLFTASTSVSKHKHPCTIACPGGRWRWNNATRGYSRCSHSMNIFINPSTHKQP